MKRQLLTLLATLAAVPALGQGTITFGTTFSGTFIMPIFEMEPGNIGLALSGVPRGVPGVIPTNGIVPYDGPLLQGTGYTLQLWAGPTNAALQPLFTTTFRTAVGNKLPAGLISGTTNIVVPGVPPGQRAWYQIRVWYNQGGSLTTWVQAILDGDDLGTSSVVQSAPLGGVDQSGQSWPIPISSDWTSFNTWLLDGGARPKVLDISPLSQTVAAGSSASIRLIAAEADAYHWFFNATNDLGSTTNMVLGLTNLQVQQSGAYSVLASNRWGPSAPVQPAMVSVLPYLGIDSTRTLTLYGGVGVTFRLDYVNALGPTNAWVTLETVTMTNNPQIYFDTSAIGQPERLYRLVRLP